jgi:SAM-dependent methyltransferase
VSGSELARGFDHAAEDYERGRPGWPHEVLDVVDLASDAAVLDLAAGTGKLTRLLVGRFARVVAVEPLGGMRRLLVEKAPRAEALAGSAEAIPVDDESVDAVFCSEAFHWFDAPRAVAEIVRVLRPRGALVLLWNRPAGPVDPPIPEQLREEIDRHFRRTDHPMHVYESGEWKRAFEGAPFEPLEEARFDNPQRLGPEELVSFIASMSWIATLPPVERERLLADARRLLDASEYVRPWRTEVFGARLVA